MAGFRSRSFTVTFSVVLALPDASETPLPMLTEQNLADPEESVNAAMDYTLPPKDNLEILHQTRRCLLVYIGWLLNKAPARYPSWAKDELNRAVMEPSSDDDWMQDRHFPVPASGTSALIKTCARDPMTRLALRHATKRRIRNLDDIFNGSKATTKRRRSLGSGKLRKRHLGVAL